MPKDIACQGLFDLKNVTVGEISGVHGVKGYIKVRTFVESYDMFSSSITFLILHPDNNKGKSYKLLKAAPYKKGVILLFEGVTRDIAETLVGSIITVSKDELPDLEPDTYYWQDIIGLDVSDLNLGCLGIIDHVIQTGSNDVFVVKSNDNDKEILIPALSWVVISVDLEKRQMIVDLPEGLKE